MKNLEALDRHFVLVWDFSVARTHDPADGTRTQDPQSRARTRSI